MGRLSRLVAAQMDGGKNPDAPARTIHEVVQEGATKLRYAVGVDAGLVVAARTG